MLYARFYMIDYIFLKISEMALRAIKAPKGPVWKVSMTFNDITYYYSAIPDKMYVHNDCHRFPKYTLMTCDHGTFVLGQNGISTNQWGYDLTYL